MGQFKEKKTESNVEVKRKENSELMETSNWKRTFHYDAKPFKVRSRTSEICYSCSTYHLPALPSVSVQNMTRRCSEELRSNVPRKLSNSQFRKLSLPTIGLDVV